MTPAEIKERKLMLHKWSLYVGAMYAVLAGVSVYLAYKARQIDQDDVF